MLTESQPPSEYYRRIQSEEPPQAAAMASWAMDIFQPRTVIDIGCATGLYLKPFQTLGASVHGIEPSADAVAMAVIAPSLITCAPAETVPPPLNRYDLSLCIETAEHVSPPLEDPFIDAVCSTSDTLIWSAAIPGQGGRGHINCRPSDHWTSQITSRGFLLDPILTRHLVSYIKSNAFPYMGWFIRNIRIFRRLPNSSPSGINCDPGGSSNTMKKPHRVIADPEKVYL